MMSLSEDRENPCAFDSSSKPSQGLVLPGAGVVSAVTTSWKGHSQEVARILHMFMACDLKVLILII